ncbi:MAG: TlpA family protein disulfide reductase [Planctomycetaceae bacterium]|nr:TlpA family protein disulfide reductase [Planctomycetaceae bacterium]MCP4463051.1 TlpA family protein disulfide reductase [Planctomycetaceae bacterium]MDG1807553.1 TlpA disulfide reductase family protein [Pirellulaceae bacterium]MDG2105840.1 TlpA disulfide reductase family protein [Pirellulaceae bacterium]
MYPHERSLVKQLAGKPFALIGVNSDGDREKIRETVKEKNITWRSFWNGPDGTQGPISTEWNVSGWPTIYVMDAEGVIRYRNVRGEAMDRALETLLAELGHEMTIQHGDEEEPGETSGGQ